MKKEFINLWENRENKLIFNKIREIKSINSLLTLKTKTLHGQHKKKVEGLYYELFEKENNNVIGTMKNMNLMMKPSFNKYKLNPVSENRLKSTSNLIELKKESRNFLTSQGYNNKANIGNIMNNFSSDILKFNKTTEIKTSLNDNFIANFERNLEYDPVETNIKDKAKKYESLIKTNTKKNIYNKSFETVFNLISPRANNYKNLVSSVDKNKCNYIINPVTKSNLISSFQNNTEVSKWNSNGFNINNKPFLQLESNSVLGENIVKLTKQLKSISGQDLDNNIVNDLIILQKAIEMIIKK